MYKIVIIGFGSAGYSALMSAKKNNPGSEITIIDPKKRDLLHPCGLPYSLEGIVDEKKLTENISLSNMGVQKITGKAVKINHEEKNVTVETSSKKITVSYSSLIIATGNHPLIPNISGINNFFKKDVHTLTSVEDLMLIKSGLGPDKKVCIVGAGAIGVETAFALREHCQKVILFEREKNLLPGILDKDMSEPLDNYLSESGIDVRLEAEIKSFNGNSHLESVSYGNTTAKTDKCILATGFRPDVSLAANPESPEPGPDFDINGFYVDRNLMTSVENIYAAGDCISLWSIIDGSPISAMLATSAFKQGSIAGINASGGSAEYYGSAGTFTTKIGELEIAGTGYTMETARAKGYNPVFGKIKTGIFPDYYPDDSEITIKIIADSASERILGAQAIGKKGAAWRINTVSACIEFAIPLSALARIEFAYCPAISEIQDPLQKAVEFALRKINKKKSNAANLN